MGMTIGGILMAIGAIAALAGSIWILVLMFQESTTWGIIGVVGLFCLGGIPSLVFVIMHFGKSMKPFFIWLAGFVLLVIGQVMFFGSFANAVANDPNFKKAIQNDPAAQKALKDLQDLMNKGKK